jgi:hypothetical protein
MQRRQLSLPLKVGNRRVEPITIETKREFLTELAQTGNVRLASMRAGVSRSAAYHWRLTDPDVATAWDLALRVSMDGLREEVVETARTMGLGRWVELLDENGQPVLDDEFEKVLEYDVSHVDARVLVKLLDKALPSADGSAKTSITVQNETHVHAAPKPMPKLVRPSMAVDVVDAEFVTENTEDAGND